MRRSKEDKNMSNRPLNKIGPELSFASTEAYNFLRINLSFAFPDKTGCKTIGVTSSCPTEGKSFTSVNLAYSLAEAGNRVLLIDCDLRRPSIARVLQRKSDCGLSNFLGEGKSNIINSGILSSNLNVIFAGDIPPNPSELISSSRMKKCLENLAPKYDYIVVDLPPANAVSDPLVISKLLDGIIVVVKHKYSHRGDVTNTIRQLQYAKAHILGFVYNGYSHTEGSRRRKGGYYVSGKSSGSSAETNTTKDFPEVK